MGNCFDLKETKENIKNMVVGGEIMEIDVVKNNELEFKKSQNKYYIKIVYEDVTRTIAQSIVEILDYDDSLSYRENMLRSVEDIQDCGGFWIDDKTIVPVHKIYTICAYEAKDEQSEIQQNRKRERRGKRRRPRFIKNKSFPTITKLT